MAQLLFQDALLNCCASEMEKYCFKNNIFFMIFLILIMSLDILLLLVSSSKYQSGICPPKHTSLSNQWINELRQFFGPTTSS